MSTWPSFLWELLLSLTLYTIVSVHTKTRGLDRAAAGPLFVYRFPGFALHIVRTMDIMRKWSPGKLWLFITWVFPWRTMATTTAPAERSGGATQMWSKFMEHNDEHIDTNISERLCMLIKLHNHAHLNHNIIILYVHLCMLMFLVIQSMYNVPFCLVGWFPNREKCYRIDCMRCLYNSDFGLHWFDSRKPGWPDNQNVCSWNLDRCGQ